LVSSLLLLVKLIHVSDKLAIDLALASEEINELVQEITVYNNLLLFNYK
jgi:hypothetical protein